MVTGCWRFWASMIALLLLCFTTATSKTVASFSRKINTCDPQDHPFQEGVTKIVWSYSDTDPTSEETIYQHKERGVSSIRFTLPTIIADPPADYFEIKGQNENVTFDVLGPISQYWCTAYKVSLGAKKHIVRSDIVLDPRNAKYIHHAAVYECVGDPMSEADLNWHGACYGPNIPRRLKDCHTDAPLMVIWGIGAKPLVYPEHVGYPLGPDAYLLMEVHYNDYDLVPMIDSSGFRFGYTAPTRPNELGVLWGGQTNDYLFTIPARQAAYSIDAFIPKECLSVMLPPEGIKIMWATLHGHIAATAMDFSVIRDGVELKPLFSEPFYDFNFQEGIYLDQEYTLLPTDLWKMSCTYNTADRPKPTYFGPEATDEMCLFYLYYYPRLPDNYTGAFYGNYTGIPDDVVPPGKGNQTVWCGNHNMPNYVGPPPFTPYVAPESCPLTTPSVNLSTPQPLEGNPNLTALYHSNQFLDPEEKYKLYWTVDREAGEIHGAVEVDTDGWVGFGVTEGGMVGADVFIAWSKDGEPFLKDRFATATARPPPDASQDYFNIKVGEPKPVEPSKNDTAPAKSSGLSTRDKAIIGGCVGGGGALILLVVVICCVRRKSEKVKGNESPENSLQEGDFQHPKQNGETARLQRE